MAKELKELTSKSERLTNSLEDFKKEHNSLTANFVIERFE